MKPQSPRLHFLQLWNNAYRITFRFSHIVRCNNPREAPSSSELMTVLEVNNKGHWAHSEVLRSADPPIGFHAKFEVELK